MQGAWAQTAGGSFHRFPRFLVFEDVSSGLALFNPSTKTAVAELYLINLDGTLVRDVKNPAILEIPPRGQAAKTAEQLFPKVASLDASLVVVSQTPGLAAYYQTFCADGTFSDGTDAPSPGMNLVFPVVPGRYEGLSEIDLANPNARGTGVELSLWSFGGELLGRTKVQVPAGGAYHNLPESIFPPGTDFSSASHITAASKAVNLFGQAQSVAGTSVFLGFSSLPSPAGDVDVAALNAVDITQTSNGGAVPHFRTGSRHSSILSLANLEPAAIDVTVTAIGNNGSNIGSRVLNLKARGGYRAPVPVVFSLGSGEFEGWLLIQASGRVHGAVIYGRTDTGSLSAIPMQRVPSTDFVFPQLVQGESGTTEIALANPTPNTSYAEVYVVDPEGETLGVAQVTVSPGARVSRSVSELLPEAADQVGGYVYVHTNEPLFAVSSVWTLEGSTLSSFTAQSLTTWFAPEPLSSFAVTGRVLLNDSPAPGFAVALSGPVGKVAVTRDDGTYAFTKLPPGRYSMMVDQFGFQFIPAQTTFEITGSSRRQDFYGYTASDALIIQPSSIPVGSPDTTVTIFGRGFNGTSQAYAGPVRLKTTFVDDTQIQALIQSFMTSSPNRFEVFVVTDELGPEPSVTQPYPLVAYQARPFLNALQSAGELVEGNPAVSIQLRGSGFLEGARVKVNGTADGIRTQFVDASHLVAELPATCFARGGIYPVTVENPYPSNVESNVQLLTVFYPAPSIQDMAPRAVAARLEPGSGPVELQLVGYGFRRGAVVYFEGEPLATTYCENDPYCLAVRLYARVPPEHLRESGFAKVWVENPSPSLAASEILYMRIEGLQPTIGSVVPGSATALDLAGSFSMPVVVNGTNFGPQTRIRICSAAAPDCAFKDAEAVSSTQIYTTLTINYLDSIGEWTVTVMNPQPGGGQSEPVRFTITEGNFVPNPFLVSLSPEVVAAGGPGFTLTVNGTNFKPGAQIRFFSTSLPTVFVSDRQLRAEVPGSLIYAAGRVPVSVTNPDNGGTSNRLFMDIR